MMLNFVGARAGNQLRQRLAAEAGEREVDDIGIAKKIKKERFDCVQRVGAAELEQNYAYSPCWVHHPPGFLAEQSIVLKIEKVGQRGDVESAPIYLKIQNFRLVPGTSMRRNNSNACPQEKRDCYVSETIDRDRKYGCQDSPNRAAPVHDEHHRRWPQRKPQ